jgi:DNA-binding response OmpR family regulator
VDNDLMPATSSSTHKGPSYDPTVVLVTEPDEQRRLLYTTTLRDAGYDAIGAADARTALTEAADRSPSIIIVQIAGATAENLSICRRLRTQAGHQRVPILVLTRYDDAYTRDQIIGAGATAVMVEPLKHQTLLVRQVRRLLLTATGRRRAIS